MRLVLSQSVSFLIESLSWTSADLHSTDSSSITRRNNLLSLLKRPSSTRNQSKPTSDSLARIDTDSRFSRTTLTIHPSLVPSQYLPQHSQQRRPFIPLSSPSSLSSSSDSSSPPSKLHRSNRASYFSAVPPPIQPTNDKKTTTTTTLDLLILSLLHQDYLRLEKYRQTQEEADERSNEWDPW